MPQAITSTQLVQAALDFAPTPYVPIFDQYWGGFVAAWRAHHGLPPRDDIPLDDLAEDDDEIERYYRIDLCKLLSDETPWPSRKQDLGARDGYLWQHDGWGRVLRRRPTSPYGQAVSVALADKRDLDALAFESPALDSRHAAMLAYQREAQQRPYRPYPYIKVGGPYLRSSFLRGDVQILVDIAEDPPFAAALAERITNHLIGIGLETLRRTRLAEPWIWIYDDIAANDGLMMSPKSYERIYLPQMRRMVAAFKAAGAVRVGMHSDGDLRRALDGLVDAGISSLNPIEPRANMDVVELRRRYGHKLAFIGGVDNSRTMPWGSDAEVRQHIEHVLSIAGDGGLVIGAHSIGPDISVARYTLYHEILSEHGRPRPGWPS